MQAQLFATNAAALIVEVRRTADRDQAATRINDAGHVAQQVADFQSHVAAIADHCAVVVVDQPWCVDQHVLAKQRTGAVVQPCAAEQQAAVALNLAAAVKQLSLARRRGKAQGHALRAGCQQALLAVVETGGVQVDAVTDDFAATVIDLRTGRAYFDAGPQHAATAVIQACRVKVEITGDCQQAASLVQDIATGDAQQVLRLHCAAGVIQYAGRRNPCIARTGRQQAGAVIERSGRNGKAIAIDLTRTVIQCIRTDRQAAARCLNQAATIVDLRARRSHVDARPQQAAALVKNIATGDAQQVLRLNGAAGVIQRVARRHTCIARTS
ncbi:hypothetical protein ALQ16_204468 [Pseudomonas syringae pv. actinidiae]|nr:hypothetical protein ALQ16_204468 [Pseudomonas syringae pv. actinidiae]RMS09989.1 hypothetical protein ALP75_200455 [Pseudomonas syringae pv. actinidiae]